MSARCSICGERLEDETGQIYGDTEPDGEWVCVECDNRIDATICWYKKIIGEHNGDMLMKIMARAMKRIGILPSP